MPTDAPFDPCRQWLGIDAVDLGNARLVLGVSPQEVDPLVVLRAAEARLNLLRAISPGPFAMARAGLIKRVEEAREKLLAEIAALPPRPQTGAAVAFAMPVPPSQRAAPPAAVPTLPQGQGVAPGVPPVVPAAVPPVPPTVPPVVPGGAFRSEGGGVDAIAIRTTVYRKKTPVAGIALTVLALSGLAGCLVYYSAYGKLTGGKPKHAKSGERQSALVEPAADPVRIPQKNSRRTGEDDDAPADRAVSTSKPPSQRTERTRPSRPKPEPEDEPMPAETSAGAGKMEAAVPPPKPMRKPASEMPAEQKPAKMKGVLEKPEEDKPADDPPAEAMAKEDSRLDATLAEALESLRRQEDDTVMQLLAVASKQAGGDDAKERVASWKLLATYYKGFLDYREKALAAVKPGDEYDVKNQKVGVVEVDDEKFIYRVAGGNKTVPRDKIPAGIVLAIVMQWFDANPANDLYVGAYHLAKPEPDPNRAREHWEQALAAGADASGLLPLLDDPVFTRSE
jgi:hypothetical protein